MTAAQALIADAIAVQATAVTNGFADLSVDVVRAYVQEWTLESLKRPLLYVSPAGEEVTRLNRAGDIQVDYRFLIGLGAQLQGRTNDEIDPYPELMEQLHDYFMKNALAGRAEVCITIEPRDWPDIDQLRQHTMFLGAFEMTYRGFR